MTEDLRLQDYEVAFVTSYDTENPFKAARKALSEVVNKGSFVVTNVVTGRAFDINLYSGEINCPECGADIGTVTTGCYNCESGDGTNT